MPFYKVESLALVDHDSCVILKNGLLSTLACELLNHHEPLMDQLLSCRDLASCIDLSCFLRILLSGETSQFALVVQDCVLVELDQLGDIFANCIGEDELAS